MSSTDVMNTVVKIPISSLYTFPEAKAAYETRVRELVATHTCERTGNCSAECDDNCHCNCSDLDYSCRSCEELMFMEDEKEWQSNGSIPHSFFYPLGLLYRLIKEQNVVPVDDDDCCGYDATLVDGQGIEIDCTIEEFLSAIIDSSLECE